MKKILPSIILLCCLLINIQSQHSDINKEYYTINKNTWNRYQDVNSALPYSNKIFPDDKIKYAEHPYILNGNNTHLRWSFIDPVAEGYEVCSDSLGLYHINGWFLNDMRISLYDNNNNIPLWEYPTINHAYNNYVSISGSGNIIAAGLYKNFYLFNRDSANPFFSFDVTKFVPTNRAYFVNLSADGAFLIAVAMPQMGVQDSAIIYGFSIPDTVPLWQRKIFNNQQFDGFITGIKMSGNDSLFILSTFFKFFVLETYTGNILFEGNVGPAPGYSNTQEKQGINGDGSVISTTSHDGYLTVYKRARNSYTMKWRYKDTDGSYVHQWMTVSDITYDGKYLACGTLDWISYYPQLFDGQIKFFDIEQGPIPKWEYKHTGEMVTTVSFSKSGNILSACAWGDLVDTCSDIIIFKTSINTNVPIFKLNGLGSMFNCNTSDNGTSVMVTGKKVHARIMGNGGVLYNISVDTNDNPIGIVNAGKNIPDNFILHQNYPNPFNPSTNIKLQIPKSSDVELLVFDILGREVQSLVSEQLSPGTYEVNFDGSNLPSGVYFYCLEAVGFTETKKMVLIK
jgi:hypothetical protein